MKSVLTGLVLSVSMFAAAPSLAGVVSSSEVLQQTNAQYSKSQILGYLESQDVQQKLVELGISEQEAKDRIANLTNEELVALNQQINDAPAGGIVGTLVTVAIVLAVLDLVGVTDIFPFIKPIN